MAKLLWCVAVILAAFGGVARADAPQILGVASAGDLPLSCGRSSCSVEMSTFCLERTAAVPSRGVAYRFAGRGQVLVSAVDAVGRSVRLDPDGIARLMAVRGNRAVRLDIASRALARWGLTKPRLFLGEGVSLVPAGLAAKAGEPAAAARIALATGPLRQIAIPLVDRSREAAAARILGRMIGSVTDDRRGDVTDRRTLWERSVRQAAPGGSAEGTALAWEVFERCSVLPGGGFMTFRQCLSSHHDGLLDPPNRAFWDAAATGS